ncbi:hypothetical protein EVB32_156 [Rhizobium phage RHph_TM39]|uniref:Uncharacterized protein n=1 Tax=Rhizobium phage RHph_TM30 TaxID=2509764 RepID=A0A7S5R514_9CAUD|nr:hypothetical protein PQC16_gp156 [Rhizobium phage RHph_TM30]QIG71625.1 hypothetical protein EVB94_154 [Rhizobium phage RHph_TM40]QIG71989.1 hypothetical protein EVB95_155 [Rhizobium phage RHph_TM2_3B]QIG72352.1 hypothetical protein EVB96_156 [Rhizobium phage RHph_TM3_3_6]QIG77144.1 hypothetical protein EVB32_156 [Rhizobium phage RHph_TM39]QIG77477.1 hypothetical protein EVB61_149 [Rhizobium phage RHph_TM21B]QIG77740.1 hypothetical protein EVB64_153 [Rhizobium phage RHph_TM61]
MSDQSKNLKWPEDHDPNKFLFSVHGVFALAPDGYIQRKYNGIKTRDSDSLVHDHLCDSDGKVDMMKLKQLLIEARQHGYATAKNEVTYAITRTTFKGVPGLDTE